MYNNSMYAPYESTANKLRPQYFSELVGQDFVINTLLGSVSNTHAAHAYLFSGPRGVGKTSAARLLALALNRPNGSDITELSYDGSDDIRHGRSLDVIEIDGASYTSVENIRSIREEIRYKPVQFFYKVYIIDEVHMLSNSAFNALLKTIEEPPEYIVFIFATTELHKVPATIRSRCQQFAFKRISIPHIVDKLSLLCQKQDVDAEHDALLWIAKEADGSMRDAYMLFDQISSFSGKSLTFSGIKQHIGIIGMDALNTLFVHCVKGEKKEVLSFIDSLYAGGVSSEHILFEASEYVRNILFIKAGIASTSLLGYALSQFDVTVYEGLNSTQVEHALTLLLECYRNIRYTTNQRFEVELTFALLCALSRYASSAELVKRLEDLQNSELLKFKTQEIHKSNKQETMRSEGAETQQIYADIQNDERWLQVLNALDQKDERLAVILDSACIQKGNGILLFSFFDKFALSTFEKKQDVIAQAVKSVYGADFQVEARHETEGVGVKALPLKNSEVALANSKVDKKEYSENIQTVLDVFGGSVQEHE